LDVDVVFAEIGHTGQFLCAYLTFKFLQEMALLAILESFEDGLELFDADSLLFP
jgi:hypothetical protein